MKTLVCSGVPVSYKVLSPKSNLNKTITILCMHNGGTDHTIWTPIAEILSEKYTVIQLDWPGYGENRGEPSGYGFHDYAEILSSFIAQHELKSVVLIGNCLGSGTALEYCLRKRGHGIHTMILFNTLLPLTLGPVGKFFYSWSGSRFNKRYHQLRGKLFVPSFLSERMVKYSMKNPKNVSVEAIEHLMKLNSDPINIRNLGLLVEALNKSTHLNTLTMPDYFPPTMVLWGEKNRVLPLKNGKKFIRTFRPTEHHVLNGGHLVMLEKPKESAEKILDFIHRAS